MKTIARWLRRIAARHQRPSLLDELIAEAVALTAWAADLNDGTRTWQEWDPELTCADRQRVAYGEARDAADEAWGRVEELEGAWIR